MGRLQHFPRDVTRLRAFEDCLAILSHEDLGRADALAVIRALDSFKSFCMPELEPKLDKEKKS